MELKDALDLVFGSNKQLVEYFFYEYSFENDDLEKLKDYFDNVELVGSEGGEDMGSDYRRTYLFENEGKKVFVQFYGFHASHIGTECYGYRFVEAKVVTRYEFDYD